VQNSNEARTIALTGSDVHRVVAAAIGLVPDSSKWTGTLGTCGVHRHGVPLSTFDEHGRVVVWVVVAERYYVVVGTRTGHAAAELSNCKQYNHTVSACTTASKTAI